ncbi:MAG TPA: hypothetical protein VN661_10480 [Candidatus Acidoferrales bacterium]|nr:hypothetical protein [Candidatus Acidoferrales bacterium]
MTEARQNPAAPSRGAQNPGGTELIHAGGQALAVRSAALVRRGLRDLARDSNWLVKKIFSGWSPQLAVSSGGDVCAISPLDRQGARRMVLYDAEWGAQQMALTVPSEISSAPEKSRAAFAWHPAAHRLIAAWDAWRPELHAFDLQGKMFLGGFGTFAKFPESLAWSESGKYLAATLPAANGASLRLWDWSREGARLPAAPLAEIGTPAKIESEANGEGFGEEGCFRGYGRAAFSPDERMIASVVQIEGEWADDLLLLAELPDLRKQALFPAQGHITSLTWTPDSREIIYCAAGQAYRLAAALRRPGTLPFGAELVACHPHLPLCVCFSSWLKNSAKGSLFLVDLRRCTPSDECPAEGVADLRWSADGAKAYAVAQNGLAYIYESPLL